jgi:superfamily II DNA or RNA helicase
MSQPTQTALRLLRQRNLLILDPTPPELLPKLQAALTYYEPVFLRGWQYQQAVRAGRPVRFSRPWACYTLDHRQRLVAPVGFTERLTALLAPRPVEVVDLDESRDASVYTPQWSQLAGFALRYKQREALEALATYPYGRISCPPGWGKSYLLGLALRLFPQAKIVITTQRVEVLQQRIYPELLHFSSEVGIIGGGKKQKAPRVNCCTLASLHHADPEADFVLVDEGHEAAADDASAQLARFQRARLWGFSATWDMRQDGKDLRCEGMFGPIRLHVSYAEAEAQQMVVPLVVQFRRVQTDFDPCRGLVDTDKERAGVWRNALRNRLIAEDARLYDADTQVLITVKTLEHALALAQLLPEFRCVYNAASQSPQDWQYFVRCGLWTPGTNPLSDEERVALRQQFESGQLRKVIATPIWNVGVNMQHLRVVIRADASGSAILDTQIPGRASRILPSGVKACGIVHDYLDLFHSSYHRKSKKRLQSYRANGWQVRLPSEYDPQWLRQAAGGCTA